VIAVIDRENIDNIPMVFDAGATEFLPVPLSESGVANIIKKVLEKYQMKLEYSKVLNEGLEYIDLLNLYQKCMKILVTTDIESLAGLVLEVLCDTIQVKEGSVWCLFREEEGFKKMKSTGANFPDTPDLTPSEITRISEEGLLIKNSGLWIAIKGNNSRLLALVCLALKKEITERESNFIKSITGFAAVAFDSAMRAAIYQQFVLKDPITDAYSFSYFTDYVEKELSKSKRFKRNFSIIMVKIDNFKKLKEEFHDYTINKALKRLIEILMECVRQTDIVAKKSDDEYYVLLPETDYFGSLVTLRRFHASIKEKIFLIEGASTVPLPVRISSGTFPRDGGTLDMLLYRIRKRLESQVHSLFKKMNFETKDFWECFDIMLSSNTLQEELTKDPKSEIGEESKQAVFKEDVIKDITGIFQIELNMNSTMRGAFFIKLGKLKEKFLFRIPGKLSESGAFRIYRFEPEDITETSPLIRFIRIPQEDAEKGSFLIAVTEDFSYGLFFKNIDDDNYKVFHTSDPFFIENLIAKLQEKYLIYREM